MDLYNHTLIDLGCYQILKRLSKKHKGENKKSKEGVKNEKNNS
jgi:hypothetical protein